MKLQDFNFRVWNTSLKMYGVLYGDVNIEGKINKKIEVAIIPLKKDDLEIELWTGFYDKNKVEIFEGDIIAHCVDGGGIEYHSKVEFNQQRGMFEFVCIEHPATDDISSLPNPNIKVIGNIHENPDLLGEENK